MILGATGLIVYALNEHDKVVQINADDFNQNYKSISHED